MSLIAEALKTAQRDRESRLPEQQWRAETMLQRGAAGWTAPVQGWRRHRRSGVVVGAVGLGSVVLAVSLLTGRSAAVAGPDPATPPTSSGTDAPPEIAETTPPAPNPAVMAAPPVPREQPAAGAAASPLTPSTSATSPPRAAERPRAPAQSGRVRVAVSGEGSNPGVDRLFEEAVSLQRSGRHAAAVQVYEQIISLRPDDPRVLNNLGSAHRTLGNLAAAQEAFQRAIDLYPRYATAWSNLGLVLDAMGERQQAAAAFEEALRLEPGNSAAKVNLAIQYHQFGLWDRAQALLEDALQGNPLMPEAHYELARLHETRGDLASARHHFQLFLQTGGERFPNLAARVRERLGRLSR